MTQDTKTETDDAKLFTRIPQHLYDRLQTLAGIRRWTLRVAVEELLTEGLKSLEGEIFKE